jgi:hypothetical protein
MDPYKEETRKEIEKISHKQPEAGQSSQRKWSEVILSNWRLKSALILMLLIAGMYGWKNIAIRKAEKQTLEQTAKLTETTDQLLLEKNRALMRMTAIPLSWVVRSEMPKGNYENIDQYFNQIIKEDHFKVILLAATDGKIMVATDKKMEGSNLSQFYPSSLLEQYETTVTQFNDAELIAAAPVMGLTAKLGMLILVYPAHHPGGKLEKP